VGGTLMLTEINFDGIIGPSHNYAGLSPGNVASASNARTLSSPRDAALQGIDKMRANLKLGLAQGFFMPLDRPDEAWLKRLGTRYEDADPYLQAAAMSASSMWAANAATVSPAPDTGDGKCHLTVANLQAMGHRSHEWQGTLAQLELAFADAAFAVHGPVPSPFGDEGAANHMRLTSRHDEPGIELFVYGITGGKYPVRQHLEASKAVARYHRLDPARTLFIAQADAAIGTGAFHNDVVAVANENVLFCHQLAFADPELTYSAIRAMMPEVEIIEVPKGAVTLENAIASYLFNAQLVTLPKGDGPDGGMALIVPTETRDNAPVWSWLEEMVRGNGPIRQLVPVDVRQSMANGGGPACLRLRVVADPASVDPRFIADDAKLDRIADIVTRHWPAAVEPDEIGDPAFVARVRAARGALLAALDLAELSG